MLTGVRSDCCRMDRQATSISRPARSSTADALPGLLAPLRLLPVAEAPWPGMTGMGMCGIGRWRAMKPNSPEMPDGDAFKPPARS